MTPAQKKFMKTIERLSHRSRPQQVFDDWLTVTAGSIQQSVRTGLGGPDAELEATVVAAMKRHGDDPLEVQTIFAEMFADLVVAMEEKTHDFLGPIAAEIGALNAHIGQFFTPWELCVMCAKMTIGNVEELLADKRYITIQEPACGSGAMALAAFAEGGDHRGRMWFDCIDLSDTCFKMTYVQMSMAGAAGIVHRGNTLSWEFTEHWFTPGAVPFIARFGVPMPRQDRKVEPDVPAAPEPEQPIGQGSLFDSIPPAS